jgi:A/G-specific adenine glycosylase
LKPGFSEALLGWFDRSARPLPWREAAGSGYRRDPYAVIVSELMLQQTQVATVIPYYERFMARFPDFESLAAASETEVLKYWEGLGYYRRAKNLLALAVMVVSRYQGVLPCEKKELLKLPGIGPYTAGAILSFAYDLPEPAVDGNVVRVLSRLDAIPHLQGDPKSQRAVRERVAALFPPCRAGDFSEALIELGAAVCTPSAPACQACPINRYCLAFSLSAVMDYPRRRKDLPKPASQLTYVLIREGELVYCRRRSKGLLSGLFEFFSLSGKYGKQEEGHVRPAIEAHLGAKVIKLDYVGENRAVFSHRIWEMAFWEAEVSGGAGLIPRDGPDAPQGSLLPVSVESLAGLPFPAFLAAWRDDFISRREAQ